jgi:hypothetical protein
MSATHLNAALIVAGGGGLALVVRLVASPLLGIAPLPRVDPPIPAEASHPHVPSDSLVMAVVAHDPFRLAHRPSVTMYDPARLAQPSTPPAPKPSLSLVGIAWDDGHDPTALVDGLPGIDGPRPLRRGETVAGLRVKAIRADRVVIIGLDTTWTLTVREPWR